MGCTRVNTIIILLGATKQISRLTLLGLKQNKRNYISILSNVQTIEAIIKWILTYAYFGNISSTKNNIKKYQEIHDTRSKSICLAISNI